MSLFLFVLQPDTPSMVAQQIHAKLVDQFPSHDFQYMGDDADILLTMENTIFPVLQTESEDASGGMKTYPIDEKLCEEVRSAFADLLIESSEWRLS